MEESKHSERPKKILRKSIYIFLQNYQYFTTTPILLIFPFSASILLSQALQSSPSSPFLVIRYSLFYSQIFKTNILQTIFTYSFALFLSLTTVLVAKAIIIRSILYPKSFSSMAFSSLKSLLLTQLCSSLIIIILNTIYISLSNIIFPIGSSLSHPILWAFLVGISFSFYANTHIISNLALIVSFTQNSLGFSAILKACSLCWNTNCVILTTNLPTNLGMFAVEALFGYRIMRASHEKRLFESFMGIEGIFIAYLYSILVVLDTITSCVFFKNCRVNDQTDCKRQYCYQIVIVNKQEYEISVLVT